MSEIVKIKAFTAEQARDLSNAHMHGYMYGPRPEPTVKGRVLTSDAERPSLKIFRIAAMGGETHYSVSPAKCDDQFDDGGVWYFLPDDVFYRDVIDLATNDTIKVLVSNALNPIELLRDGGTDRPVMVLDGHTYVRLEKVPAASDLSKE